MKEGGRERRENSQIQGKKDRTTSNTHKGRHCRRGSAEKGKEAGTRQRENLLGKVGAWGAGIWKAGGGGIKRQLKILSHNGEKRARRSAYNTKASAGMALKKVLASARGGAGLLVEKMR